MGRPQFSIAALLLTVAAVAVVLALMRTTGSPTEIAFVAVTPLLLGFVGVGIFYGQGNCRPFCLGALPPLLLSMSYLRGELNSWLVAKWMGSEHYTSHLLQTQMDSEHIVIMGAAILAA